MLPFNYNYRFIDTMACLVVLNVLSASHITWRSLRPISSASCSQFQTCAAFCFVRPERTSHWLRCTSLNALCAGSRRCPALTSTPLASLNLLLSTSPSHANTDVFRNVLWTSPARTDVTDRVSAMLRTSPATRCHWSCSVSSFSLGALLSPMEPLAKPVER